MKNKIIYTLIILSIFSVSAYTFADLKIRKDIIDTVSYLKRMIFTDTGLPTGQSTVVIDGASGSVTTNGDINVGGKFKIKGTNTIEMNGTNGNIQAQSVTVTGNLQGQNLITNGSVNSSGDITSRGSLSSSGNINVGGQLCFGSKCYNDMAISTGNSAGDSLWKNGTGQIYYTSGNVGIGTTNPSSKLEVQGAIKTSDGGKFSGGAVNFKYHTLNSNSDGYMYLADQNGNTGNVGYATDKMMINGEMWYKGKNAGTSSVQTWLSGSNSFCDGIACQAFCIDSTNKVKGIKWLDTTDKYYTECFTGEGGDKVKVIINYR